MRLQRDGSCRTTSASDVRSAAFRYVAEPGVTGYSISADRLVRAVRAAGVPVELRGWPNWPQGQKKAFVSYARDNLDLAAIAPPGAPTVMHLVPEHLPEVAAVAGGPVVVHTVWETDRVPDHWPALLNDAERVIVPTGWNRDVFAAGGVDVPIDVVPHVACEPRPGDRGAPLGLSDDVVVFYTISTWDERKVPHLVVQAFLDAFTSDDPVALVVKTGATNHVGAADGWGRASRMYGSTSWEIVRLVRHHSRPPPILLEVGEWDDDRIAGLHARGDCYVTLTHGEGWGVGSFDACAYGNPVIATGWGGHLEYLDDRALLVDHEVVPVVHSAPRSYSPEQQWAEPSQEHAVELMRAFVSDSGAARRRAQPLRERVLRDYAGPIVAAEFLAAMAKVPG